MKLFNFWQKIVDNKLEISPLVNLYSIKQEIDNKNKYNLLNMNIGKEYWKTYLFYKTTIFNIDILDLLKVSIPSYFMSVFIWIFLEFNGFLEKLPFSIYFYIYWFITLFIFFNIFIYFGYSSMKKIEIQSKWENIDLQNIQKYLKEQEQFFKQRTIIYI